MLLKKIIFAMLMMCSSAMSAEYTWVKGKFEAVYNSGYNVATPQQNVSYHLKVSKLKMIGLDMSKIASSNKWQALVGKNVEIKVTTLNYSNVSARVSRKYEVLDIKYRLVSSKKSSKAQALAQPDAKKPWLNLLCKFADIATEPHPSSFYQTMFGNTYPYLEHYWKDTTYGYIDISGTQTLDWVSLPHDHAYYKPAGEEDADRYLIREDCIEAAGGASILNTYYGLNIFVNGNMFDNWAGYGGGGTTWIDLGAESSLGTIAHEMGHGYGLPHSSGRYGNNYDSPWDVMSNAHRGGNYSSYNSIPEHTIAYHKQKLGAINVNLQWSNASIDASAGEVIHLSRLEENAVNGDYLIANIFSLDGTKHYTVESRDKIGYDSILPAKAVIIHEIDDGPFGFRAYVVDPDNNGNLSDAGAQWQVGETFTDSANNISVEIISSTATGYNIRITAPKVKPSKVQDITATYNLLEKVRVSWSPSVGAEYYKVSRYNSWDINSTHQTFTTANSNTYYDDVPDDAYEYYYRIQSCNSAGCSTPSAYPYAGGSRTRVSNVAASDDQINNIHISWDALVGATSYTVIRYDDYQCTTNRQEFTTNNAYYDDDIQSTEASYYYYKVQACNSNGCSPESYSNSGREVTVSDINASTDLSDKVTISWSPVSTATYYKVLRYDGWSLTNSYQEFVTDNNSTSYEDIPNSFSTYFYRIKACSNAGCSLVSQYQYDTGKRVLPINASDGIYDDKVIISYPTLPSFVTRFNLFRAIEGDNSYSFISSQSNLVDTTAQENVKYEYVLYFYDINDNFMGRSSYDVGYLAWDTDGDGVSDNNDAFPNDPNESLDTDNDGVGNNADEDDDNDGILDTLEIANGLNPLLASDAQADLDNDGFTNAMEIAIGTNIRSASSKPIWTPIMMGELIMFVPAKP